MTRTRFAEWGAPPVPDRAGCPWSPRAGRPWGPRALAAPREHVWSGRGCGSHGPTDLPLREPHPCGASGHLTGLCSPGVFHVPSAKMTGHHSWARQGRVDNRDVLPSGALGLLRPLGSTEAQMWGDIGTLSPSMCSTPRIPQQSSTPGGRRRQQTSHQVPHPPEGVRLPPSRFVCSRRHVPPLGTAAAAERVWRTVAVGVTAHPHPRGPPAQPAFKARAWMLMTARDGHDWPGPQAPAPLTQPACRPHRGLEGFPQPSHPHAPRGSRTASGGTQVGTAQGQPQNKP